MPSMRDKAGRPIVVVTGLGVVTSLGAGKADNWAKLTAGQSGIRSITRFATDNLKTRIAGTIDFVPASPLSAPSLSERLGEMAAAEAVEQAEIGRPGDFPGPLFLAVPPVEVEWTQRRELAAACGANDRAYGELLRVSSQQSFFSFYSRFKFEFGGRLSCGQARHQGIADLAVDRLRLRRNRDPTRRRSHPEGRNRCGARRGNGRLGKHGIVGSFLASFGTIDCERPATIRREAILQKPRRLRHGRGCRRPRARKL